jgi:hypothetical protein
MSTGNLDPYTVHLIKEVKVQAFSKGILLLEGAVAKRLNNYVSEEESNE